MTNVMQSSRMKITNSSNVVYMTDERQRAVEFEA